MNHEPWSPGLPSGPWSRLRKSRILPKDRTPEVYRRFPWPLQKCRPVSNDAEPLDRNKKMSCWCSQ